MKPSQRNSAGAKPPVFDLGEELNRVCLIQIKIYGKYGTWYIGGRDEHPPTQPLDDPMKVSEPE
jgi:hypothetical protein